MNIQLPRGTYDLFGNDMRLHNEVKNSVLEIFDNYGYSQIKTPIFEHTNLFIRSVGESSDIVNKEMYTFNDKSDRSLTLRPELTAPTVRSYLENKLYGEPKPFHKLSYYGEAFRYERAQAGRYRQFHQLGTECFGIAGIEVEAETIAMAMSIFTKLGIADKVTLKINTIGTSSDRANYVELLKTHFAAHIEELCEDCKMRFEKNPLRILDCKIDKDHESIANAPKLFDSLSEASKTRFTNLLALLTDLGISYQIDDSLVRGLDYYNDTVFEVEYTNGKTNFSILGGGRYDNMVGDFNPKQATPAFGLGVGIERLIIALKDAKPEIIEQMNEVREIYYMPRTPEAIPTCLKSINTLRDSGLKCEMDYNISSFKSAFKQAEKLGCVYGVIIGERELEGGYATIKQLFTQESFEVKLSDFEQDLIEEGENHEH
ncbi:histidine--tRNA ligase [Mollicutes bacterium LVI A0039]|nr:histidine--tRNA ligase [Mollicutes bacterium LVI A0039]